MTELRPTADIVEQFRTSHPGCVWFEAQQGLLVVKRPTAAELVAMEDGIARLTDLGSPEDPYAGIDAVKRLTLHPDQQTVEGWLNDLPGSLQQVVNLARLAAFGPTEKPPILREADLREEELWVGDGKGGRAKRHGGKLFVVEHVGPRDPERPFSSPPVLGRYLMRLLGLTEHRSYMRELALTGILRATGVREPTTAQLAAITRSHVCSPMPEGCSVPDFEAHPYLLRLLGQTVIDKSRLEVGGGPGK